MDNCCRNVIDLSGGCEALLEILDAFKKHEVILAIALEVLKNMTRSKEVNKKLGALGIISRATTIFGAHAPAQNAVTAAQMGVQNAQMHSNSDAIIFNYLLKIFCTFLSYQTTYSKHAIPPFGTFFRVECYNMY